MRKYLLHDQGLDRLIFATMAVLTFVMSFPLLWLISMSFKTSTEIFTQPLTLPASWDFNNYVTAFRRVDFLLIFGNSTFLAVVSVVLALAMTIPSSFVISRLTWGWNKHVFVFFLLGLAVPVFIMLVPIFEMTHLFNLWGTYTALILPYAASQISFNTLLFVGFLRNFPRELEDAAVIDGCNMWRMIRQITLPILKPAIATACIFNFIGIWNEFPLASILITKSDMKTVAFFAFVFQGQYSTDYAGMAAALVVMIVPQIIIFVLFQKQIVEGVTAGAVKG